MRLCTVVTVVCLLCFSVCAQGLERKPVQIREDFGMTTLQDCTLQYYYYIPCPTYSWFWGFSGWSPNDIVGTFFTIGDAPTGLGFVPCDSAQCMHITGFRILDLAGYGEAYPGLYTIKFNIYCADASGMPVGPSLWESPGIETAPNWNSVVIDPPLLVSACTVIPQGPAKPRILLAATHTGSVGTYPQWGMDNISGALAGACVMHDAGCLPALYPRPSVSHYPTIHSGFYGPGFLYSPPEWFADSNDTVTYGYLEFAWRLYVTCQGNATEPATWGRIKSIYR
jgi:hypothetical protein